MMNYVIYKDNGTILRFYHNQTTGWTNSLWNATKYDKRSDASHVANKLQDTCEFPIWITEECPEDRTNAEHQ